MRLIADFYDESAAREASEEFERIFKKHGAPDDVATQRHPAGKVFLPKLLVTLGLATSNSEATRLIAQGGVKLDDTKVAPETREIEATAGTTRLVKVGKRHFARVTFE
jgi:tyrosyl-tRNA synthetase